MKLILTKDVAHLGTKGQIVEVVPGFARNFLLPQQLAHPATAENIDMVNRKLKKQREQEQVEREKTLELARRIEGVSLTIRAKAGEEDKLYGSVTAQEITESIKKDEGIELDRHQIVLAEPIRALGMYSIEVKLPFETRATFKIWVVRE